MARPRISIIGLGALGTALCRALVKAGCSIPSVFNRTDQAALDLAADFDIEIADTFPADLSELGEIVFITVSDSAIANISQRLSALRGDLSSKTFVHCSGNESANILSDLKAKGASIAAMHPLQTFSSNSDSSDFQDIYFSLQGDAEAMSVLSEIAETIGAKTFSVTNRQKSYLHTAAVMASNYVMTLIDAAAETGGLGGLGEEQISKVLYPLTKTTLRNITSSSFEDTLSGPIARGDVETVKKHLDLLENHSKLRTFYAQLGLQTVGRAEETGKLSKTSANELRQLLQSLENDG